MMGSSPLARGLQGADSLQPPEVRIIPARAGFTPKDTFAAWAAADHPRSRGVYTDQGLKSSQIGGSSPLARGLLCRSGQCELPGRIIPARAGFTRIRQFILL